VLICYAILLGSFGLASPTGFSTSVLLAVSVAFWPVILVGLIAWLAPSTRSKAT
jgi:hypothetical protein